MTALVLLSGSIPAWSGMNSEVRIAIDMRTPVAGEDCASLHDSYASCADIRTSVPEGGPFEAVVVVYTFQAMTGVEYVLQWPEDWSVDEFTSCSDLTVGGDISQNPMTVSQVWTEPVLSRGGTSGIPVGILRGSAATAGCVEVVETTYGYIQVTDASFDVDEPVETFAGCVGVPSSGDPCAFDSVLVADLFGLPRSGEAPLEVAFHDASRGSPAGWFWNFGDGATSTLRNPVHTYDPCGFYSVSLQVTNETATDDTLAADYVRATTTLIPDYDADPVIGCPPLAVQFTDLSQGEPLEWSWDFGDGGTSSEQNPLHVFTAPGDYDVTLTIASECSTATRALSDIIHVKFPPSAEFTASPRTGCAPLQVHFTDRSSGTPTSWLWEFGDGVTSTATSPTHTYVDAGLYSVTLTVANDCSTSTIAHADYIEATQPLVPDLAAEPTEGCAPLSVQFTDLTTGGSVATWSWDFGDGGTSTEQNPLHTYEDSGIFDVTLTVTGDCGTSAVTRDSLVGVRGVQPVDFTADPTSGCIPLEVQFNELADPLATAWDWDFGDGGTSTERNPLHVYVSPGLFDVTLEATGPCGISRLTRADFIRADSTSVVAFSADDSSGCAPFTVQFTDLTTPAPAAWAWEFGDGGTSTERNPVHTYTSRGSFDVSLEVEGLCGLTGLTQEAFIRTDTQTCVDFVGDPLRGCPPLAVQFTDLTTPAPTAWSWDFGDGGTSSEQNPAHVYDAPGLYDVSLEATAAPGTASRMRPDYVLVDGASVVDFAVDRDAGCPPLFVRFTDLTTPTPHAWLWDFGDGETSTLQSPTHTYESRGAFTVTLMVEGPCDTASATRDSLIHTDLPVEVDFTADRTSGCPPLDVRFTDHTSPTPTSWLWHFGDGETSTARNPSHTYTIAGSWDVTLETDGPCGEGSLTRVGYIHTDTGTCIGFSGDPRFGCIPHTVQFTDLTSPVPTGWLWDFGDGGTSTERDPVHVYTSQGHYDVTLTAMTTAGPVSATLTDYIWSESGSNFCRDTTVAWIGDPQPSPSRGGADFEIGLPPGGSSEVELSIYDARGRKVGTLLTGVLPEGRHRMRWNGDDGAGRRLPAGIYFLHLQTSQHTVTQKVLLYH